MLLREREGEKEHEETQSRRRKNRVRFLGGPIVDVDRDNFCPRTCSPDKSIWLSLRRRRSSPTFLFVEPSYRNRESARQRSNEESIPSPPSSTAAFHPSTTPFSSLPLRRLCSSAPNMPRTWLPSESALAFRADAEQKSNAPKEELGSISSSFAAARSLFFPFQSAAA